MYRVTSYDQLCHAKSIKRLIPEFSPMQLTVFRHMVAMVATYTDLCQCNVLLRSNTLRELLVKKVNCIPVHSIESALCMKYETVSKNLRVYIS